MGIPVNKILARIREGKIAKGCALTFPSNNLVELVGLSGLDFLYLDGEHGSFSPNEIEDMCRVAELYGVTTVARVPDIQTSTILMYLDRGVMGIEGPHVTTPEDAKQLVNACYFSPIGSRGISSSRGARYGTAGATAEYTHKLNEEMFVFALLEDVKILDDLDGLLAVEGIHAYHVGTEDLAGTMGHPGNSDHPDVVSVAEKITDEIHTKGKKLSEELVAAARGSHIFLDGLRTFAKGMSKG